MGVVIGAAIVDGLERRRGRKGRTAKSGSVAADARVVVPAAVTYGTGRVDALGGSSRTELDVEWENREPNGLESLRAERCPSSDVKPTECDQVCVVSWES